MSFQCAICGKEENSLLRVNHKNLGNIKLCVDCWSAENSRKKLLPVEDRRFCCR